MTTDTMVTTQVYRVYIKASPQAIWDAITRPEWTERYGFGGRAEYDLRPGGAHRVAATQAMKAQGAKLGIDIPELMIEGEVLESDPPHSLVVTFRMNMGAEYEAEVHPPHVRDRGGRGRRLQGDDDPRPPGGAEARCCHGRRAQGRRRRRRLGVVPERSEESETGQPLRG